MANDPKKPIDKAINLSVNPEVVKLKSLALEKGLQVNVQSVELLLGGAVKLPPDIQAGIKAGSAIMFVPEKFIRKP